MRITVAISVTVNLVLAFLFFRSRGAGEVVAAQEPAVATFSPAQVELKDDEAPIEFQGSRGPVPEEEVAVEGIAKAVVEGTWAEMAVTLDGVHLAEVDLDALSLEEVQVWRELVRELQRNYKQSFVAQLPSGYPYEQHDTFVKSGRYGSLDIHYFIPGRGDVPDHYVAVPESGNPEIYSLRNAAMKIQASSAYQEKISSMRDELHSRVEMILPGQAYDVVLTEDGGEYMLWGTVGGYYTIVGSVGSSVVE